MSVGPSGALRVWESMVELTREGELSRENERPRSSTVATMADRDRPSALVSQVAL